MLPFHRPRAAPPFSDTSRWLAQRLAEKAAANLRLSGWTVDVDGSGRYRVHRPSKGDVTRGSNG